MASLLDIDCSLPVNFTPVCPIPTRNPSEENFDTPLDEGVVFSGPEASVFWGWLSNSDYLDRFEQDLQSLSQTAQGAPLLTTWLEWGEFMALISAARVDHALPDFASTLAKWSAQGAHRVYIDGFARM